MQRTSKRVVASTAIPATLKPHAIAFKPSSVLSSDIHWRKTVKRKTKGTGRTMKKRPGEAAPAAAAATVGGKAPKVVTSEYIDKFVEWDIPEMYDKMRSVNHHHHQHRNGGSLTGGALTGMYENDLMVSDWQSEQKRSYVPMLPSSSSSTEGHPPPPLHHHPAHSMSNISTKVAAGFIKPRGGSVSSAFMWDDEDRLVERPYEG